MTSTPAAAWLDLLWEAVCVRAAKPIPGITVDREGVARLANEIFRGFLASGESPSPTLQTMMSTLSSPVRKMALSYVAEVRERQGDGDALRDSNQLGWPQNPPFPELITRGNEGELPNSAWAMAEPILWQRASPVYRKLRLKESDARDVYGETLAYLLRATSEEERCPFRKMQVFEEVPLFFGTVAHRRAVSWLRKETTQKNQPNQTGISFDDPDHPFVHSLAEPRSLATEDRFANATFGTIRAHCEEALDEFEWHLMETLFVEGTQTRDELVCEREVLEMLEVSPSASRSTKLRRLNSHLSEALARLGEALDGSDL